MRTRGWLSMGFSVALFALVAGASGCGGTEAPPGGGGDVDMIGGATSGDMAGAAAPGSLALFAACTADAQCMSGLCTQTSYDRSPTPICTYMCDASDQNPNCPMGCNPKGYCKKPN